MGKAQAFTLCQKCNVSYRPGSPCKCVVKVSAPDQAPFVRDMLANMHRAGGDPLQPDKSHKTNPNDEPNNALGEVEALAKYCLLTRKYLDEVCGLQVAPFDDNTSARQADTRMRFMLQKAQSRLRELAWPKPKAVKPLCRVCHRTDCLRDEAKGTACAVKPPLGKPPAYVVEVELSENLSAEREQRVYQTSLISGLLKTGNHRFAHVRLVSAMTPTMVVSGGGNAYVVDKNSSISLELQIGVRYALFAGPNGKPLALQWFGKNPMDDHALEQCRSRGAYGRDRQPISYVEDLT